MLDRRLGIKRSIAHEVADYLADELGGVAATMRCSPATEGWGLDFLGASAGLASAATGLFRDYITSAPADWTMWDPTRIAPQLQNAVQLVDNRLFAEVDVVKRVYGPLGLAALEHVTLLASSGPRFLGWVGVWRERPFDAKAVRSFARASATIRERFMAIDELGSTDVSWAIIESSLEALERPAFLVRAASRIELANAPGRALLQRSRRSVLEAIERALAGGDADWTVCRVADTGVPDLAIVSQSRAGASFEDRVVRAQKAWSLSGAQVAVLRLIVKGSSNKEIAASLQRAEGTVEIHVTAILQRANVDSRARLLVKFWQD